LCADRAQFSVGFLVKNRGGFCYHNVVHNLGGPVITEEGNEHLKKMKKAEKKSTVWFFLGMGITSVCVIAMFIMSIRFPNLSWLLILIGTVTIFIFPFTLSRINKWSRIAEAHAANARFYDSKGRRTWTSP
jgi:hypothetical protein